jgi:hypothetical protein
MDRTRVDYFEWVRAGRNRLCARLTPSRMFADRAALYVELHRRRRRAVLMARRALAGQDCSNGSFHCAVNSSRAAEAAIGSTDRSAA